MSLSSLKGANMWDTSAHTALAVGPFIYHKDATLLAPKHVPPEA
jgi:hypothetical protein